MFKLSKKNKENYIKNIYYSNQFDNFSGLLFTKQKSTK